MTDRELLELAAKAAELTVWARTWPQDDMLFAAPSKPDAGGKVTGVEWDPLTDDGDALRLAVLLRLSVEINQSSIVVNWEKEDFASASLYEYPDSVIDDDYNATHTNHDAATRRAIVRAAAEIGRQK